MTYRNTHWNIDPIKGRNIKMYGVIHIGAHYGQEYPDYINNGLTNIIWIEPLSANYKKLLESWDFPDDGSVKCLNLAIGNFTGEVEMFVETANWGMSSSILEPGSHLEAYPQITFDNKETVRIDKLDNVEFDRSLYNVLNVDVQGYELEVFKGATETLKHIDVIFTEVNTGEVYKGCGKLGELDLCLSEAGFDRIHVHIYDNLFYGDAVYLRRGYVGK